MHASSEKIDHSSAPKRSYTIVGIDPGTTTAVAVLNLRGRIIRVISSRSFSISDIIGEMVETGRPLIVATDKYPAPGTVEKIKRAFSAVLYAPQTSLSVDQKIRDTKSIEHANDHERDALAAALDAYRSVKNKFEQIERRAPEDVDTDEIKALVLRGHSLEVAVGLLRKPLADVDEQPVGAAPHESSPHQPDLAFYREIIRRQDEQIMRLLDYIKDLKTTIVDTHREAVALTKKIDFLRSDEAKRLKMNKEIALRDKEIKRLSRELTKSTRAISDLHARVKTLKKINEIEIREPTRAINVIKSFNKDAIQLADEQFGLFDSIVLFEDASGGGVAASNMLAEKGVKAVIVKNELSHPAQRRLYEADIPVFAVDDLRFTAAGDLMTVDRNALDQQIERWHRHTEATKRQEQARWLESMVETYKSKRGRDHRKRV